MTGQLPVHHGDDYERWYLDVDLLPLVQRLARIDPTILVRLRSAAGRRGAFAVLPTGAMIGRTVQAGRTPLKPDWDVTVEAGSLLSAPDAQADPPRRDEGWRAALPPTAGWDVLERVPGSVIRTLLSDGARAHEQAARDGLGARAAQDLLDLTVLSVRSDRIQQPESSTAGNRNQADGIATVTNRMLAALAGMGFLPESGHATVAVRGRWTRVAAQFGSVFREDPRGGLALL